MEPLPENVPVHSGITSFKLKEVIVSPSRFKNMVPSLSPLLQHELKEEVAKNAPMSLVLEVLENSNSADIA